MDIALDQETQRRLRRADDNLQIAMEAAGAGIWDADFSTLAMNWDAATLRQFSLGEGEPAPDVAAWIQLIRADDRARVAASVEAALQPGCDRFDATYRLARPAAVRWIRTFGRIRRDARGTALSANGISLDVTEARQAQLEKDRAHAALALSQKRLDALIASVSDVIMITSADGTVQFVNEAVRTLAGHDPGAMVGRNHLEWVHPDDHQKAGDRWRELLGNPARSKRDDYRIRHADGRWRDVEVITHNLLDEPAVAGIVLVARDVTERKAAEDATRHEKDFNKAIIESLPGLFYVFDDQGRFVRWNEGLSDLAGYSNEEMSRMSVADLFTEPETSLVIEAVRQAFDTGTAVVEASLVAKDGTRTPHLFHGKRCEHDGRPCLIGLGTDITERKRREQDLKLFRELIDCSNDSIEVYEPGTMKVLDINKKACSQLGYSRVELLAMSVHDIDPAVTPLQLEQLAQRLLVAGSAVFESMHRRKDGSTFPVEVSVSRVELDRVYQVAAVRDITERKRTEAKLRLSLEGAIGAISATMEARDPYTAGHQHRVGDLGAAIAAEMGLSPHTIEGIRFGGLIHDIGKIQVPAEILTKPTRLTKLEFELIKTHPQAGYDIIKGIEFPWPVALMVLQHHERLDGSGYPQGLKGSEIAVEAKILAVADAVEAMSSHRPYRPGKGIEAALREVEDKKGVWFDPMAVDACLKLFREQGFQIPG